MNKKNIQKRIKIRTKSLAGIFLMAIDLISQDGFDIEITHMRLHAHI